MNDQEAKYYEQLGRKDAEIRRLRGLVADVHEDLKDLWHGISRARQEAITSPDSPTAKDVVMLLTAYRDFVSKMEKKINLSGQAPKKNPEGLVPALFWYEKLGELVCDANTEEFTVRVIREAQKNALEEASKAVPHEECAREVRKLFAKV